MFDKPLNELTVDDLNTWYFKAEEADKRVFAEMRTNLMLVSGEHYQRDYWGRAFDRIREAPNLNSWQRLKLTKNHIQRVTKAYRNAIERHCPDVAVEPGNEKELADQKVAELYESYWQFAKKQIDFPRAKAELLKLFVELGETAVKIYWDDEAGRIIGYEAKVTELEDGTLVPVVDDTGNIVMTQTPVYGGAIKWQPIEPFNLRRDPGARKMSESPLICVTQLVARNSLRAMISDKKKLAQLESIPTQEYTIFDSNTGSYRTSEELSAMREYYIRPSRLLPNGYFYYATDKLIISQGELPYGEFPIEWEGFDEQTGNPRCFSIIRPVRPCQVELNRCASRIAEAQVTHGDDKIMVPANTKISQGALLPGVRTFSYSGGEPKYFPGRAGDQYFEYMTMQVDELYRLANIPEINEEQQESPDLMVNLWKSYRFRNKFVIYGEKFERFLQRCVERTFAIAKASISEDELIPAVGRTEMLNASEFKFADPVGYRISVKARTEDMESQFGKQVAIQSIIQYVGSSLDKEDLGLLLRVSPFLNKELMLQKFTLRYDAVLNDILALDRGIYRPAKKYQDHQYYIQYLTARMSRSDYEFLPDNVKALYEKVVQEHQAMAAEAIQEIERAKAGFIPSGGYLVKCDFYVGTDPNNPQKVHRVALPSESIDWLIKKLDAQGTTLKQLEALSSDSQAEIAQMFGNGAGAVPAQGDLPDVRNDFAGVA
jgi:hypothetical protein